MPPKAPDASDADGGSREAKPPRVELARLRELQSRQRGELDRTIMEAVLLTSGEEGYRNVTVEKVIKRYGGYRFQFYRHFANLGECYAIAYEAEAEGLCREILRAGAMQPTWRKGLRAALERLASFAQEQPMKARALLIDVHVAGGPAMDSRKKMFERLSRAIDSARREIGSRHSPPPLTSSFMVSAIEAAVVSALFADDSRRFAEAVPELVRLIVVAYFGDETQ